MSEERKLIVQDLSQIRLAYSFEKALDASCSLISLHGFTNNLATEISRSEHRV